MSKRKNVETPSSKPAESPRNYLIDVQEGGKVRLVQ